MYIVHLGFSKHEEPVSAQARSLIILEDNSELKVVENWRQWRQGRTFENHVSEISVAKNARLDLYTIQNSSESDLINFTQVNQGLHSLFRNVTLTLKGELVRNNLHVRHTGEHCETQLFGLYLLDNQDHVDNHTLVDHAMPNCYSNELYKGVLNGNSTAVFNGKVMVRPDAQKTNAFQSNKTILLSDGATINTKPQLEIFADDVKCSHGATTGRLDKTALFFLRSRGLPEKKARALLTYAFAAEVLKQIRIPALHAQLVEIVEQNLLTSVSITNV
ncbi:MAG TPA: Fe-S cluster assembly protein SufD [Bacteroidetes bacterium]|nr:Fe-S cluster assembly protein SufD [Bacteroidota bacterium]